MMRHGTWWHSVSRRHPTIPTIPHLLVKAGGHLSSCCSNFIGRWLGHGDARPARWAGPHPLEPNSWQSMKCWVGSCWFKGQFIDVIDVVGVSCTWTACLDISLKSWMTRQYVGRTDDAIHSKSQRLGSFWDSDWMNLTNIKNSGADLGNICVGRHTRLKLTQVLD